MCDPPNAKQYRQKAQAEDMTFSRVLQNPDACMRDIVLPGGSIIETKNLKEGTGRPRHLLQRLEQGRFCL
jgi:hypothetical protein